MSLDVPTLPANPKTEKLLHKIIAVLGMDKKEPEMHHHHEKTAAELIASMRFGAALAKLADDAGLQAGMTSSSAGGTDDTTPRNYLAAEMTGRQAQEATESAYYRQQLLQSKMQQQGLQQQMMETQNQIQQLQQQADSAGAQIQQAAQEAMAARDSSTQAMGETARARMGAQRMREAIMNLVSQDPGAFAPPDPNAQPQMPVGPDGQPMPGPAEGQSPMGAGGPPPAGQQAPDGGMMPPPGPEGPAAAAASPATPPGSPPLPGAPDLNANSAGLPGPDPNQAKATTQLKTAGIGAAFKRGIESMGLGTSSGLAAAGIGAAGGAGLGALDALRIGGKVKGLRRKLEEAEQGGRGLTSSYAADKLRAELAEAELYKLHMGRHAASRALTGGLMGGLMGPHIRAGVQEALAARKLAPTP